MMPWDFALILIFLAVAVPWLGRRRLRLLLSAPETTKRDRLALYASTAIAQWLLAAIVFWRVTARGINPRALGFAIPHSRLAVGASVLLCALVLANQFVALRLMSAHPAKLGTIQRQMVLRIFPQDNAERLAFSLLVVTVAICEEFIYRGFAQLVFQRALGGEVLATIAASAILFALAHLYQGRRGLVATFLVGVLFSCVRAWTGSLLPSMLAHFATDLTVGFLAPERLRRALAQAQSLAGGGPAEPSLSAGSHSIILLQL
jgi:uncharacterized protein